MTNSKKKVIIVGSFVVIITASTMSAGAAEAGFFSDKYNAIRDAIFSNNYEAFKDASKGAPIADKVDTPKEFHAIALAHDLRRAGRHNAATEALERAGIERPWPGKKQRGFDPDMRQAVEGGDWEAFQEAVSDKYIGKIINTEEEFNQFIEMNELHKEGRHGEAYDIARELGLKNYKGPRK